MKPTKSSQDRWKKYKDPVPAKKPCTKSSAMYFCGRCDEGFRDHDDWDRHFCDPGSVHGVGQSE